MTYDWAWYVVPRALPALFLGLRMTIAVTVVVIVLGFFLGILVAAGRLARSALVNKPVALYIEFFRGTPALIQLVWIYYCLPIVLGLELPTFASIVVAFTLNVGAFYGEAIRAGIQAIPRDQIEAADILGLALRRQDAVRGPAAGVSHHHPGGPVPEHQPVQGHRARLDPRRR